MITQIDFCFKFFLVLYVLCIPAAPSYSFSVGKYNLPPKREEIITYWVSLSMSSLLKTGMRLKHS